MKIFLLFLGLFVSGSALSESLSSENDTKAVCKNFSAAVMDGKVTDAFSSLKEFWPLPEEEVDNLAYQTERQLNSVAGRFGEPIGISYLRARHAGDSLIEQTFIGKFQKTVIIVVCVFYKPDEVWFVNAVYWHDQVQNLFE